MFSLGCVQIWATSGVFWRMPGRDAASEAIFLDAQANDLAFNKRARCVETSRHKRIVLTLQTRGSVDLAGAKITLKLCNCVDPGLGECNRCGNANE